MKAVSKILIGLFVFSLLTPVAQNALAAESARIEITGVYGSNEDDRMDPQLRYLLPELQSISAYSSYKMLRKTQFKLEKGETGRDDITPGYTVNVEQKGFKNDKIMLNLKVMQNGTVAVNTDFSIINGGTIVMGGPSYKEGVLILVVLAKF